MSQKHESTTEFKPFGLKDMMVSTEGNLYESVLRGLYK